MTTLRRFAYAVFGVACTHLVFGAIVRISGSGMGCGPHWPKCYGRWFPPMDRPDLVIEVTHRYLASILLLSLIALSVAAWRRRAEAGVGGPGGVLRMALLATGLGFSAAILGAVTVKFGNAPLATVAHWTVAMSLVAAVTATVIRAGGLGGASARRGGASGKTRRASLAGAGLALTAVVMGGLTAKVQGGPIACLAFPLCGANPAVPRGAVHVQGTHRVIAVLLVLHLVGLFFALRKRQEAPVVRRAASIALGLGVLQLLIAGAMIGMHLPPVLRSLHEATGVSIWIATFALAYLARLASDDGLRGAERASMPVPAGPLSIEQWTVASGDATAAVASGLVAEPVVSTSGVIRLASTEVHARATPATALAPVLDAPMAMTYRPPTAIVAVVPEPRVEPVPAEAAATREVERAGDQPIELPSALAHAARGASRSALAFHDVAAVAAVAGVRAAAAVGSPPSDEVTATPADDEHPIVAPVIIPDVDELYNLRGLDVDEELDDAPRDADDLVASLDEEFSRLAIADAEAVAAPIAAASAPFAEPAPPVRAPMGTLSQISAARRPAMSHSVAVIVARGAEF